MSAAAVVAPSSSRLRAYVELTKPRIIELLLVTTVPAMFLAADGWPGGWLIAATLIGGTLSAAGANSINNVVDRDIDKIMQRTSKRPFPTERVTVKPALALGVILGVAGLVWLWLTVNLLAGLLSTSGLLFYVFVYTLYLKRTSTQNIVIGGAAGAVPALVGWAAVTDSLSLPAWILFAIVFFWTPPHFWALSLKYKDDYAAAGVPMLPVVAGEAFTLLHIFLYSVLLVAVTLLLFPAAGMGLIYLGTATVLGVAFVAGAARLRTRPHLAMKFFGYSNLYLVGLSVGIIVDRLVA